METSSVAFLDQLLISFRYPLKSATALLDGVLPLRYCAVIFARKVPTLRLPPCGRVACLLTEGWKDVGIVRVAPGNELSAGSAAGVQHFFFGDDEPTAAGSRPDWLSAVSGPQERVLRHTVEQMVDCVLDVPIFEAPVSQLGCGEEGGVLSHWEPLPPPARVRSCHELAADLHRDLARLGRSHRTVMEVIARGITLTWDERRSMVSLMPNYSGRSTDRGQGRRGDTCG